MPVALVGEWRRRLTPRRRRHGGAFMGELILTEAQFDRLKAAVTIGSEESAVREGLVRKEYELPQVVDDNSARPMPLRTAGGELFSFNCGDLADRVFHGLTASPEVVSGG
jgi:hypothetical protein